MAIPVGVADVERVLRPWLGTLFLSANPLAADVAAHMRAYAPYRQTLESLRDELESLLLVKLNRLTSGHHRQLSYPPAGHGTDRRHHR